MKSVLCLSCVAILCATAATAVPFPPTSKYATHLTHTVKRRVQVESYHPPSTYETFGNGIDHPMFRRAEASVEESALAFVQFRHGMAVDDVHLESAFDSDAASHVYFKQNANNISFANAVANVAFSKSNKVVAFGSSFVNASVIAPPTPSLSVEDAIATAEEQLDGSYDTDNFPAPQLQYLVRDDGSVTLTHSFQVRNAVAGTWFQAFVDAHTGELVSVTDYVAHASYLALPIWKETLSEGLETILDPQDLDASPEGWHNDSTAVYNTTVGNNAMAYKGDTTAVTTASASDLVFNYPPDLDADPTTDANVDAARVNTFYVVNTVHDIMYKYGFTETAFNFQWSNFGKGGKGGDRVQIMVQSNLGTDNAAFTTLPDGLPGFMYMMLWDYTSPERDGALENDIVAHENTHGLTNRMTGGGTASCLQTTESRGMGEGWSDAFADWLHKTDASVPDFFMGQFVTNSTAGSRSYPYSTSATTNPLRYSSVQTLSEVHDIGEVWANMLHNVYAALVEANGFSDTARTDPSGTAGNVVFLHLFVDALALQPCNPTFVSARDAWIQADVNRYGGANKCTLWKAFASRGLGVNAANYVDDGTIPDDC